MQSHSSNNETICSQCKESIPEAEGFYRIGNWAYCMRCKPEEDRIRVLLARQDNQDQEQA